MATSMDVDEAGNCSKEEYFSVVDFNGKKRFRCDICRRYLSSKHSVLQHLHSAHNKSPVKRVKKQYLYNATLHVPRSTMYRKRKLSSTNILVKGSSQTNKTRETTDTSVDTKISRQTVSDDSEGYILNATDNLQDSETVCLEMVKSDSNDEYENVSCDDENRWSSDDDILSESSTGDDESESDDYFSDSDESTTVAGDERKKSTEAFTYLKDNLTETEKIELSLLSCFLGNKMSGNASKNVLKMFKKLFLNCTELQQVEYEHIWKCFDKNFSDEIHYCEICNAIFPDDTDQFGCSTPNCTGLRYKGINQKKVGRQPRAKFVFANVRKQLKYLLQSPGIWENVKKNKKLLHEKHGLHNAISDITDGSIYKELMKDQNFLGGQNNTNLTFIFNTDGINLYSSSKIELWPIFIAINELSPKIRFSRENVLLAGIWQGKGKPPMGQFLQVFSETMNDLYANGLILNVDKQDVTVKAMVICGTCDLPAKASVLNMTLFNGSDSCITCEEPGTVVSQGKGHSRCFPYRLEADRFPLRTEESVRQAMEKGSDKKRCKGFKGKSGLSTLQGFCTVDGMVPDYMHCVLLGTTKNLLHKWFSPTQNKKPHFIGDKLPTISQRLKNIKPPEFIERLPRNIENNYSNFKATELQSWLLYYSLPCLSGLLDEIYFNHFMLLSEGIYILLGDNITEQELNRAGELLDLFYEQFSQLYAPGSCGLNVHNIGVHLIQYVRKLGPVWSWSCFPFEDTNSMILKTVHGTGNVTQQVMKIKEAEAYLRNNLKITDSDKIWKKLTETSNCYMAGAVSGIKEDEHTQIILTKLDAVDVSKVKKCSRIMINGKRFYSESYSRMKNRICHVVLTNEETPVLVKYFCMHEDKKIVYAVVNPVHFVHNTHERNLSYGKHLTSVEIEETVKLTCVDRFQENLFYIDVNDSCAKKYIVRMPNRHGHSVFK